MLRLLDKRCNWNFTSMIRKDVTKLEKKYKRIFILLTNRGCLPESNTKTILESLILDVCISFVHHGHKLVIIYATVLQENVQAWFVVLINRVQTIF